MIHFYPSSKVNAFVRNLAFIATFLLALLTLLEPAAAQENANVQSTNRVASLKLVLQKLDPSPSARYIAVFADLNGKEPAEAIVYMLSQRWCGSGGCFTFIFRREGGNWVTISKTSITRPPIYVLDSVSNGWHSIGVWVQGGGIQPGYEAELPFTGKTYPLNPTTPPSRPVKNPKGSIVISSTQQAIPLYAATIP
jgi:hypothetical protein